MEGMCIMRAVALVNDGSISVCGFSGDASMVADLNEQCPSGFWELSDLFEGGFDYPTGLQNAAYIIRLSLEWAHDSGDAEVGIGPYDYVRASKNWRPVFIVGQDGIEIYNEDGFKLVTTSDPGILHHVVGDEVVGWVWYDVENKRIFSDYMDHRTSYPRQFVYDGDSWEDAINAQATFSGDVKEKGFRSALNLFIDGQI